MKQAALILLVTEGQYIDDPILCKYDGDIEV